jgi:hypothetical protein
MVVLFRHAPDDGPLAKPTIHEFGLDNKDDTRSTINATDRNDASIGVIVRARESAFGKGRKRSRFRWRMSEDKLQEAIGRAARAQRLVEDALLAEAFDALDRDYVKAWRESHARDTDARERLWQAVQIVAKVRSHLSTVVNHGKLAQRELDDLAARERRRLFGVV